MDENWEDRITVKKNRSCSIWMRDWPCRCRNLQSLIPCQVRQWRRTPTPNWDLTLQPTRRDREGENQKKIVDQINSESVPASEARHKANRRLALESASKLRRENDRSRNERERNANATGAKHGRGRYESAIEEVVPRALLMGEQRRWSPSASRGGIPHGHGFGASVCRDVRRERVGFFYYLDSKILQCEEEHSEILNSPLTRSSQASG